MKENKLKMQCIKCKKGDRVPPDTAHPGWYVQWICSVCGNAQCQQVQVEEAPGAA